MKFWDITQLGLANLWRMRLRTFFTVLGVIIGVGALSSMVSFGFGMQKNMEDAFKENDLFTSLNITAKNIDLNSISEGNLSEIGEELNRKNIVLNDSILELIKTIDGVTLAIPEITFPVKVKLIEKETNVNLKALPLDLKDYYPFNTITYGSYFSSNSAHETVLRKRVLNNLNIKIREDNPNLPDTSKTIKIVSIDSIVGSEIEIITKEVDIDGILKNPFALMMSMQKKELPIKDTKVKLKIVGIIDDPKGFARDNFGTGIFVPITTAKSIPNLGFSSVWDLLGNSSGESGGYGSIYVRINRMENMDGIIKELKDLGLNVFAFADQLKEIKKVFLIMDSFLGAIGLIALVVAALGIINTMLMSILERTREIGIMKSIGGSENQIRIIFFVESSIIGFIGGIFGLILGWIVTRFANIIMNSKVLPEGLPKSEFFYFPIWLIFGALAFSILISLIAGLYPANHAARIDPVKALRHD